MSMPGMLCWPAGAALPPAGDCWPHVMLANRKNEIRTAIPMRMIDLPTLNSFNPAATELFLQHQAVTGDYRGNLRRQKIAFDLTVPTAKAPRRARGRSSTCHLDFRKLRSSESYPSQPCPLL